MRKSQRRNIMPKGPIFNIDTFKSATLSIIRDSKPVRQYPSANKLYFQTSDIIINQKNHENPGSD
jgi:hypothetical protein